MAFLSGTPVEPGDDAPDAETVELTEDDLRALEEFVAKEREYDPPEPDEYFTAETLMRLIREECPPGLSDEACRNWLDERLLEYALEEVARTGGDVRCYAEPTKFNVLVVLSDVRRKRLALLPDEERERRLIKALPGRIVARHVSNRSMPEARRWMDVGALDCARLVPLLLPALEIQPVPVETPPQPPTEEREESEKHELPTAGGATPSDDLSWLCPSK